MSNSQSINVTQSDQHLVGEKKSRRKKIIWGSIIGAVVIAIVVVVVVLVTKKDDAATEPTTKEPVDLNDFLGSTYSASHFNGTFISDHEVLYQNADGLLVLYDVTAKTQTILLSDEDKLSNSQGIWVSPNKEYLLIARERIPIYRHSFSALYDVLVLADKSVIPITVNNEQAHLQLAEWNPVTNGIVFVHDNNIYYKNSPTEAPRQLTVDGSPMIYNGVPDWVYEEEVFASNSALWFSPDGNKLAYAHFDDTPVRTMVLPVYGTPGSIDFQYTRQAGVLYPKAGSPNPIVNLFSVDLTTTAVTPVHLAYVGPAANQKPLLTAVTWIDNSQVIAVWMNRIQNEAYIHKCTQAECTQLASITSTTGWVDLMTAPLKNKDGSKVAIIASQPQEGGDSFKHVSLISTTTPNTIVALTKGKFVVTEILKWDAETDLIFYMANTEANSEYNHLYTIKADGTEQPACLSCDITAGSTPMTYFSASISSGNKNIIALSADGPAVPMTMLYTVELTSGVISRQLTMNWELNGALDTKLESVDLPTIEKDTIDLGNGFSAKVKMQLPPGLNKQGSVKYPMIIDVYGGPDSNGVLDRWSIDYGTYMSSHKKVIYARIDGRGSGLRGDALMHQIYRKLGTAEIQDQITAAKKLAEKYSFIDAERIAIWGWSYGGYASAMALAKDTDNILKCAASVAPVTDWAYYDSIYTERYMGLPSPLDNQVGYDTARLSTLANDFSGKKFLLIHGTLDDNVHYQQAMALSRSLERNDILFKQITYPDENHSLSGVRPHLYHSLSRYFSECFGISEEF